MNKITNILIFLILLSIFSNIAISDIHLNDVSFTVDIETIKDRIDFQENARFKITIDNPGNSIERFTIKPAAPFVEWFIKTDPISDYLVKVYPNSKTEVFVIVKPLSVGIGRHAITINVKNEKTKELFKKDVVVNVISMSNVPGVSISAKVPEKIDPRKSFIIKVWLENRNSKNLEGIKVDLRSDAIQESTTTTLGPIGAGNENVLESSDKKTLEFKIKLDDKTPPIKDNLRIFVSVKENDKTYEFKSTLYDYEIIKYGGLVDKHSPKFRFLGSYDEISFVNDGNTNYKGIGKIENPIYRALFTKTTPKPFSFAEGGKRYIGWDIELKPKESFNVIVRVNYIPLAVVLIVLIVLVVSYFRLRSPIILTKSVQDIVTSGGGVKQFKVVLHIKNRFNKNASNVSIIDRIPDIADFEKFEEMGTLQPTKVVHTKRGIIAKWVIENLEKDEETVIKYGVKSRLSILGKFQLASCIAKFKDDKGKIKRSYSNNVDVGN